jgi:N-acyl-D-aspartate/D-glutamate deacylase
VASIVTQLIATGLHKIFPLGDPPDYEPGPEKSIRAIAEREGRDPYEVLYDQMLELDGRQLLMLAILSYHDGDLEALREMLEHPDSAFGLGDGGAHCGASATRHDDVPAESLGARSRARRAAGGVGGAQDDSRHGTSRPRRAACSRPARRATST